MQTLSKRGGREVIPGDRFEGWSQGLSVWRQMKFEDIREEFQPKILMPAEK
jgi:hypothetical protein